MAAFKGEELQLQRPGVSDCLTGAALISNLESQRVCSATRLTISKFRWYFVKECSEACVAMILIWHKE